MILIYLASAWMIGMYCASQWALPLWLWGAVAVPFCSVIVLWKRQPPARLAGWCGLFLCLGALRYLFALPHFDAHSVATYNDRGWVTLTGIVAAEPDVRDSYANLRVRAETLAVADGCPFDVGGMVLVRAPRYPEFLYGDRVQVHGQLETPPVFDTFSYRDYLARKGVYSLARWAQIDTLARGQGNPLMALLLQFKRHTQGVIAQILPEPAASLLTGILLGIETGMSPDLAQAFSRTGTSHIIAISGFNMALISGAISSLSIKLAGRRSAAWFSTAAIALYTLLVGASAAVVRAALMGCVGVWGQHFGRQNSAPNALFATALLMTAWSPHALWDLGFQLSFAATLGLILLADPVTEGFKTLLRFLLPLNRVEPAVKLLEETLILTACAQLTTLPIILYNFHRLSLIALLSNALALPAQNWVMLFGALAVAAGLLWLPLGRVLGWAAWLFLSWTIGVVEWTAAFPRAEVDLGWFNPGLVAGWYALLMGGWWLVKQPAERRKTLPAWLARQVSARWLIGLAAIAAVLAWTAALSLPDGKLHVTFFDVGEGDAVLIETPRGQQILVNGGPAPSRVLAQLGQRLPFWDRRLDLVILTDVEDKHLLGLVSALARYRVDQVLQGPAECDSSTCEEWQRVLQKKVVSPQVLPAGAQIDLGDGLLLAVLHAESLTLRIDYGSTCFLLAASATEDAERAILAQGAHLRCDVLQVGDGGSRQASTEAFLEAVNPALAVISCGENQRGTRPAQETLDRFTARGATVAQTCERGNVEVISDGGGYTVR
ncbi:MAG: ComEC/Rec2 family competence protein [Anaerolineae bacterium]|nr:ComEC/Rec2 family competence protein [Anaerolineae bacterium]